MAWARFDDRRAMNAKLRKAGFAAAGLDAAAICQCAGDQSDGHIDRATVEMLAAAHGERQWQRLVAKLVEVGRWEINGDGWYVHDYLEYNPSRADQVAERDKKRAAGRRGGQAKAMADAVARATAPATPNARAPAITGAVANVIADPTRPDPKGKEPPLPPLDVGSENPSKTEIPAAQGAEKPGRPERLAQRLVDTCRGYENPRLVRNEASAVVAWAIASLDASLVDQAIGEAGGWDKPPVLPRAVAAQILLKASDNGIVMAPFVPLKQRQV